MTDSAVVKKYADVYGEQWANELNLHFALMDVLKAKYPQVVLFGADKLSVMPSELESIPVKFMQERLNEKRPYHTAKGWARMSPQVQTEFLLLHRAILYGAPFVWLTGI